MIAPQVQVTLACNLDCSYCFEDHTNKKIMDDETLEAVIRESVKVHQETTPPGMDLPIIWHGGEPLIVGIKFYKKVLAIEAKYPDVTFKNMIQTNGELMTEEMARFLHDNGIDVGFSVDGPAHIHNRYRKRRNGAGGSFDRMMKGLETYRRVTGIKRIPVLSVISRFTIEHGPKEYYEFFKNLGCSLQLQPYDLSVFDLLHDDDFNHTKNEFMPAAEDYGRFAIELFDLWFHDDPAQIEINEFKTQIKMFLSPDTKVKDFTKKKRCAAHRVIFDPLGRTYFCDLWVNNNKSSLGNIKDESLETMMERKYALWDKITDTFRTTDESWGCFVCRYKSRCSGGCITCFKYNYAVVKDISIDDPKNVDKINKLFAKNLPDCGDSYYSVAFKMYKDHIRDRMQTEMGRKLSAV